MARCRAEGACVEECNSRASHYTAISKVFEGSAGEAAKVNPTAVGFLFESVKL